MYIQKLVDDVILPEVCEPQTKIPVAERSLPDWKVSMWADPDSWPQSCEFN